MEMTAGDVGLGRFAVYELLTFVCGPMPGGLGLLLRRELYPKLFSKSGRALVLGRSLALRHPNRIELGHGVVIDDNSLVDGRAGVRLDDEVIVNRNCILKAKTGPIQVGPVALAGSIDNGEEVAAMLGRPLPPEGDDDAGLILELYQTFGPDGFQHLSGPFAVALWDDRRERLVLARNARGSCPRYVAQAGGRYLFASEYKALLAIDALPARPNRDAIQHLQCTKHVMPDARISAFQRMRNVLCQSI
jgi:hypothetical protein